MRTIPYSSFRQDLKSEMRRCRDDCETLLVTNKDDTENIVVMSAQDYESLMETIRVYENPYLFEKVLRGMDEIRNGKGISRELVDA